jgi:hypothetical protein
MPNWRDSLVEEKKVRELPMNTNTALLAKFGAPPHQYTIEIFTDSAPGNPGTRFNIETGQTTHVIVAIPTRYNKMHWGVPIPVSWRRHYAGPFTSSWEIYSFVPVYKVTNLIKKHGRGFPIKCESK